MATVVKDFKIKSGLVVEGTTGTINGYDILTKKTADQNYIIGLIGGSATSDATADTVVLRDENGSFAATTVTADLVGDVTGNVTGDVTGDLTGNVTGDVTGNLTGDVTGNLTGDVTGNVTGNVTGDLTGDVTGNVTGDLTGNVTGNVTGNLTGDVTGTVSDISNHDTDSLSEGEDNLYFTTERARDSFSAGDGINLVSGAISAQPGTGIAVGPSGIEIKRSTVDSWYDAAGSAADAQAAAESYADSLISDGTTTTSSTWSSDKINSEISSAVAGIVDGAPELLDTLNELAAAIGDNPDTISNLQNLAAGKQDALTVGANIDITDDVISVTGLDSEDISDFDSAAVSANTGLWDDLGAASDAQAAAEAFATAADSTLYGTVTSDIATAKSEAGVIAQGYAATAQSAAQTYADGLVEDLQGVVDALTTDDVAEGTSLYFTDARAKTSAAELLTNASLTNITITGDGDGIVIAAENGVADSDTDDLAEGEVNLYFTDERAVEALEAVTPNFTEVELNSVALQVAAAAEAPTAGTVNAFAWAKADYRSAEFLVKVAYGTHTEISKVLLTLDTLDNIAITEYGIVGTNGSASSISAAIDVDDVVLQVTTANNNSDVTVVGTLLV